MFSDVGWIPRLWGSVVRLCPSSVAWACHVFSGGRIATPSVKLVCTHTICPHHIYTVDNRSYMVWTTVVHTICYPQHISLKGVLHSIYPQHNLCHPRYIHMMSTPYSPQHICRPHHMARNRHSRGIYKLCPQHIILKSRILHTIYSLCGGHRNIWCGQSVKL